MFLTVGATVPLVRRIRLWPRNRHHETTVLDTLQSDEAPCELFDMPRLSVNDEHLETRIMVEVSMTGRHHQFVVGMLEIG